METTNVRLGKVVKSNSHCDYVVQLDNVLDVASPPTPEDYGFGSFVKLETGDRHWAVGLIYNSQLSNPQFQSSGPRFTSEPDPFFTPDLVMETQTLLGVILIGSLACATESVLSGDLPSEGTLAPSLLSESRSNSVSMYGQQGIPRAVVPVNTPVLTLNQAEIHAFHHNQEQKPQFCYYSHLIRYGGSFATYLTQQVLAELFQNNLFTGAEQRALAILGKELAWRNTMGVMS